MLNVGSKEGQVLFVTDSSLKTEAYLLKVTPEQILIKASDTKGFFYALQSIRQLLPAAIESGQPVKNVAWSVPAVTIQDEPRFGFRDYCWIRYDVLFLKKMYCGLSTVWRC